MYVHFNELKQDLSGMIKKIGEFLEIDYDINNFGKIVDNCTFESMKARKDPEMEQFMKGGMSSFINKGTNNRWKDVLNDDDIQQYKDLASYYMDDKQIKWLETGEWN